MVTRRLAPKTRKTAHLPTAQGRPGRKGRRAHSDRASQLDWARAAAGGPSLPEALHEAIEIERGTLSKAESLLGCMAISMEYGSDSLSEPHYPDLADMARELVRKSINGLDSLALERVLLRNKVKEESDLPFIGRGRSVAVCREIDAASAGCGYEVSILRTYGDRSRGWSQDYRSG